MFGLDAFFKQAHLLTHVAIASLKWLQEPSNPVMAYVPAAVRPAVVAELATIQSQEEAKLPSGAVPKT